MKKYKLKSELAAKWVQALRSGNYRKTTGKYKLEHVSNCFCAMGLFANVNNIEIQSGEICKELNNYIDVSLDLHIVSLNDGQRMDFPEIADWIEENVEFI